MVVLIGLLERSILSEESFGYLLEVVKRAGLQRVELIRCHTSQTRGKGNAQKWIITRINHHLVPKMPDVSDGVAHPRVVVEG